MRLATKFHADRHAANTIGTQLIPASEVKEGDTILHSILELADPFPAKVVRIYKQVVNGHPYLHFSLSTREDGTYRMGQAGCYHLGCSSTRGVYRILHNP